MTQQSNTPEIGIDDCGTFDQGGPARAIQEIERERDEARESVDSVNGYISHLEIERDQLRKVVDELHWLASLADYDSQRRDDALSSYNNLPHVIARKEKK